MTFSKSKWIESMLEGGWDWDAVEQYMHENSWVSLFDGYDASCIYGVYISSEWCIE